MADLSVTSDDKKKKQDVVIAGGGAKEKVEVRGGKQEKTPITEYTSKVELEPEVEGWLEKLEKEETQLQQAVTDDKGQVILDDSQAKKSKFKIVLPMTKSEVEKGLHHKLFDSVRWLAEWCVRLIKMFGNKVAYRRK